MHDLPAQKSHSCVSDAYSVLESDAGAPLKAVKSAYKKARLSLHTHPDKNPNNPTATQEFQAVSEAYRILLKHLSNDDGSDHSDYDANSADDEYMFELYMRLHELFMRGEEHAYYARAHKLRPRREEESEEHYRSRVQRHLDEQQAGEERRKREGNELKAKREVERDRERREAEKRQRIKSSAKKALATEQRQKDIDTRRLRQEATQKARSAVFAAARVGDAKRVKQGVWGEYVDASGGEIKDGCQDFVKVPPSDPQETLLHIAARNGDHTLVKWLDGHGAELEERDSNGFTAFHVALKYGHLSVVAYFFDEHVPSADTTKVYELPPATSLLSLALDSLEPELVWMILDRKLASKQDMSSAWERLSAERGKLKETVPTKAERIQDIEQLLGRYGGFTSRSISRKESRDSHSKSRVTHAKADTVPQEKTSAPQQGRQRARRRGRGRGSFKTSMAMR